MSDLKRMEVDGELVAGDSTAIEVVGSRAIAQITKAETDTQIVTAKRFPRSIKAFNTMATEMATMNEQVASGCFYSLPRGGKKIEGPSVRLAEIVANAWGNLQFGARIVDDDGKMVTAQGVAWDLERNIRVSVEVQRRVTGKDGKRFNDDMVIVTCNAAAAIAMRNAIFKVVPMVYVKEIEARARQTAIGDAKTLTQRRHDLLGYFAKMGVDEKRLLAAIEKRGVEDIGLEDLATLKGMATAIKDGDTTIDEAFPDPNAKPKTSAKDLLGKKQPDPKPESDTDAMQRQDMIDYLNSQAAILTHPDDLARLKDELDAQRSLVGDVVYEAVRKTILGKVKK